MKKSLLVGMASVGIASFPFANITGGEPMGKEVIRTDFEDDEEKHPDENLWIYTTGTKVRDLGSWEFKLKDISRFGKREGSYQFHDIRPEIEYGLTENFTVGASLMMFHHDFRDIPWGPMNERGGPDVPNTGSYTGTQLGGFELNTKYNIFDPFEDDFGLSLGLAYEHRMAYRLDGSRINQDSVVPILYLQKSLMDDKLQVAFKGKLEFEQRKGPGVLEEEIAPDLALGVSYNVRKDVWVGVESRWQSDFLAPFDTTGGGYDPGANPSNWDWGNLAFGDQFQWGLYVGPTIHWNPSEKPWWMTAGALWQVKGWSADGPAASSVGRDWDEHEQFHFGITFGYEWEPNENRFYK